VTTEHEGMTMSSYPTLAQADVVANNTIAADDAIVDVEVAFVSCVGVVMFGVWSRNVGLTSVSLTARCAD
jgi:hypothetical protein